MRETNFRNVVKRDLLPYAKVLVGKDHPHAGKPVTEMHKVTVR